MRFNPLKMLTFAAAFLTATMAQAADITGAGASLPAPLDANGPTLQQG